VAGFETLVTLDGEAATQALGARIALHLEPGCAVLLSGALGAGKTALARAILRARGVEGRIPSPSFTLAQRYDTQSLVLHHIDLYRIEDIRDMEELGLEDALAEGAVLVEWPERAGEGFFADALCIALTTTGPTRRDAHIRGPERFRAFLTETA
jgi:tRNA threonylcarbamoyladenosine biosynthesis protein TsaE